ncbi:MULTISPECIES: ROK family protein [unclassified Streptomyces]|uniref:ROK family protein n=1 Tax=unclassified Streptomyces TaxID=2593676 RepID=UPI00340E65AB
MRAAKGCLGIDFGGTKVALRVESEDAQPDETVFRWPDGDITRDLTALSDGVRALLDRWPGTVGAVGVAMPATLDRARRVVSWPGRPSWAGTDIGTVLQALFPTAEVRLADDGDLAALAEAAAVGRGDIVYLGVGTGIGGGFVLGGRPALVSGEVGHMIIDRSGPVCDCGRRGCLQSIASGPATLRRAAFARGAPVTFEELRAAWLAGEPWAVSAVDESCAALAASVVGLCELVHPAAIVVGGGFATGLPGFTAVVDAHTHALQRPGHPAPEVHEAVLGGLSSLRGALLLAREAIA